MVCNFAHTSGLWDLSEAPLSAVGGAQPQILLSCPCQSPHWWCAAQLFCPFRLEGLVRWLKTAHAEEEYSVWSATQTAVLQAPLACGVSLITSSSANGLDHCTPCLRPHSSQQHVMYARQHARGNVTAQYGT